MSSELRLVSMGLPANVDTRILEKARLCLDEQLAQHIQHVADLKNVRTDTVSANNESPRMGRGFSL